MAFPRTRREARALLIALNTLAGSNRHAACAMGLALSAELEGQSPQEAASPRHRKRLRDALRFAPQAERLAGREEDASARLESRIITAVDDGYPAPLRDLDLPPPVLYCRGELGDGPGLAIVGSRRSDPYGLEAAETFARHLAARGLTIVSGLALGIDAAAHRGALAGGGRTVAVLGCGIDVVYPTRNRELAGEIPRSGAIVSEYPLGTQPKPAHFPVRNRIISALALGTLVVRATPLSGSLITARHALDLGREVFALPGNVFDPRSIGPNSLIRDGAHPVQHPSEIVEALPASLQIELGAEAEKPEEHELDPSLANLLGLLPPGETVLQEEILARSELSLDRTLGALLELELAGWVARHAGPSFMRRVRPVARQGRKDALRPFERRW